MVEGTLPTVLKTCVAVSVFATALLAGCTGAPASSPQGSSTPAPVTSGSVAAPSSSPGSTDPGSVFRCPALAVPADPVVACTELRNGVETYSDQGQRSIAHVDYYVVGECVGSGDLDELPYTVKVDDKVVSSGSITCRTTLTTKNSAFSGVSGRHRVTIRFADGIGTNGSGYALVTTG